jgi:hypothetical protein
MAALSKNNTLRRYVLCLWLVFTPKPRTTTSTSVNSSLLHPDDRNRVYKTSLLLLLSALLYLPNISREPKTQILTFDVVLPLNLKTVTWGNMSSPVKNSSQQKHVLCRRLLPPRLTAMPVYYTSLSALSSSFHTACVPKYTKIKSTTRERT